MRRVYFAGRRCSRGRFLLLFIFLLGLFVCVRPTLAQQNVTSASLRGLVSDANEAAVDGALVTLTHTGQNLNWSVKTGNDGRFRFPFLPAGDYKLRVTHTGFAQVEESFSLSTGQTFDVSIRLNLETVTGSVNINSDLPPVETARTQVSDIIQPREIDSLPLNGRNYLDLALLTPAVSRTNTGSNQRFSETSAVPGQGLSVAGQRNLYNSFVVDGLSANDDAADLTGTYFSQEVVREFQVVTSGGIAEFGRASAGVINITTQSGTNEWRGRLYGLLRNQRLDARNPLAARKDSLTQAQYGASVGGPLSRNRTFLFANFEQTRRNDTSVITITDANTVAINNRLNQVNYPGPRVETGLVPAGFDATNFFARVDHRLNGANLLTVRYSLYKVSATNSRNVGGLNAVSRGSALDNLDQTFAVNNVTTVNSTTLNEARFQFTRSRLNAPVNDSSGPAVNINGVASFGTATFSPLAREIDLFELVDNISTVRGEHSVKAGVDFLQNRVRIDFPGAVRGVYTFTSLNNFLGGSYSQFQQAFGAASQSQSNPNTGFFIQDEWRPRKDLTLNAGLRYDAQFLPDPVETDANNFAPRFGLAYSPGDRKTVLRASFGIYFDRIPLRATSNALQRDGSKYIIVQLSPAQAGAPVFPNVPGAQPATLPTRPNITRIDPEIRNSYSEQASLQIERELFGNSSISIGYLHLRGLHLLLSRNINVPRFPASAGVANLGRPDPDWGNITRYESSGDSYYNALVLSFNRRAARWANLRVSYTLSKTLDDAGNFFFSSPQNNFDIRDDLGPSDNDQRHRLVISGTLEAPQKRGDAGGQRGDCSEDFS
jgi:hypothetical protein